ncbi:hypothetical protein [Corynebacterium timonense]|uniref:Uncharacterized protein n=1 Tax=Corynebacterium timonense TaxID=441500 RepID=A0A1H1PNP9_9CORY|nr:hypothetical protein [Corynebacterium timonense]SDS12912.1 hypothetical protein SAMN04488539_1068 [Corynebacterium timonense]
MRKILASSLAAALVVSGSVAAAGAQEEGSSGSSRPTEEINRIKQTVGTPSEGLQPLNPDPANDPLYIDPEKNPLQKVSSSDMFLDWTMGSSDSGFKEFLQGFAAGSSIPNTANPIELLKQELQGNLMMSSGLFTGDFAQSSRGSSQALSVYLPILIGAIAIGQLIEVVVSNLRNAGITLPL